MFIEVCNATKEYLRKGQYFRALNDVSLTIDRGEFICLLGPSGCGKTTLLNAIAGFEQVSSGSININGRPVTGPSADYITIFQNYGLLPWRTVQKNVELGLERHNMTRQQRREIASRYLDLVGLSDFRDSHPCQLSGGMQQRVAIARALAVDPEIIFMDEPFAALDALTRFRMQTEIIDIWSKQRKTILFVTHDIEEAVFLADRIVVMTPNPGKVKKILPVTLPRIRDRNSDEFVRIRHQVLDIFRSEEKVH